jgi:uncharacterized protein (DUF433 family)
VKGTRKRRFKLYGGTNPADLPRYTRLEASRATGIAASTIGVWVHGMPHTDRRGVKRYYGPVITLPDPKDPRLSFNNLLEANVLRALRKAPNDVQLKAVRVAIANAKKEHKIDRLLLHPNLRASGGELFLDYYFKLVTLSNSEQMAMRAVLEHSLQRVEIEEGLPVSFFPTPRFMDKRERPILVSPFISLGSAVVERRGVSTSVIRSRVDAGEKRSDVIADYDLTDAEFEEAILYETAA